LIERMDQLKAAKKYKELEASKSRRIVYAQHLKRQESRLARIAILMELSPDEARELLELMIEWFQSERILDKKAIRISKKRIQ
jgi:hypothetical protein